METLASLEIETVEMHTGGEPVRIVVRGYPEIRGATLLDKRRYARRHLDAVRRMLMHEPRGHRDMYGAIPLEPDDPEADFAVLFLHNEGYSTMCGHAVIALARFAVDRGLVEKRAPETPVNIQCPCGLVRCRVEVEDGRAGDVRFESVPAFAVALGREVEVPGHGTLAVDVAYGGAFYALAPAAAFGLDVRSSRVDDLVEAADRVTRAVRDAVPLAHPEGEDLAFLYGTILVDDGGGEGDRPSANVCVFADRQVDRCPTGSGVTARLAAMAARGEVAPGETRTFESVIGTRFSGRVLAGTRVGDLDAVVVEVAGRAHYTGTARFSVEPDDPLGEGFLLR